MLSPAQEPLRRRLAEVVRAICRSLADRQAQPRPVLSVSNPHLVAAAPLVRTEMVTARHPHLAGLLRPVVQVMRGRVARVARVDIQVVARAEMEPNTLRHQLMAQAAVVVVEVAQLAGLPERMAQVVVAA